MTNEYLLITPCKNEGKNLPQLIDSIAVQTVKPILWIIIDDGSSDNTPLILNKTKEQYRWIKSIRIINRRRDIGLHLAEVMKRGLNNAISYCTDNGLTYEFLGNVDGDLTLPNNFFENLIREFNKNPKLGIASGGTKHLIGNRMVHAKLSIEEPSGGHMLIRRKCFEECGGIPITYSVDSVLKAKARLRGWETRRYEENITMEIRDINSAEGYWRGSIVAGKGDYYINYNPIHVLVKSIIYSKRKPYYRGIAYLLSYIWCFCSRKEQIKDEEVRNYFWNKWKRHINF